MRPDEKVEILYRKETVTEGTGEGRRRTVGEICYLVDGRDLAQGAAVSLLRTVEAVDLSWCGRQILKRFLVAFP